MLTVNEIFGPTIQGEGKSAGRPVIFLRLGMCNLSCIWCDTPHTWNWTGTKFNHPEKFDKEKELHRLEIGEVANQIRTLAGDEIKSLVISGGEPLIQQRQIVELAKLLKQDNWWIEVETNGTIEPSQEFRQIIDQINCSPKLENSENERSKRIRPAALEVLAREPKTNFKFVVSKLEDLPEIMEHTKFVREHGNPEIRLMPLGQTREELEEREPMVQELCRSNEFIYTTRLSVLMAGTKRGV
jgi:7-carboxy-7-deazaguanine synthase